MKTPKEKAQELIEKFYELPINFDYTDSQDGICIGDGCMTYKSAKECAKIAVNEILDAFNSDDIYIQGENNISYEIEHWQEVLKEIENL